MDVDPCDWSFSTDSRALAEESWARMLSDNHLEWSLEELLWTQDTFSASVRRRAIGDLVLVDCDCDPSVGRRRPRELARTDDAYLVLLMTLSRSEVVEQAGAQSRLVPGSAVVWDSEEEAMYAVEQPLRKRSLVLPKAALAEVGVRGHLQTGRVLDHTSPAMRLLSDYLEAISSGIDDLPLGAIPRCATRRSSWSPLPCRPPRPAPTTRRRCGSSPSRTSTPTCAARSSPRPRSPVPSGSRCARCTGRSPGPSTASAS